LKAQQAYAKAIELEGSTALRHASLGEAIVTTQEGAVTPEARSNFLRALELDPNATDSEVKKAYRKMAVKYHPDKVRNLGKEHQEAAEERFIEVQKAYETIKESRGMK
ncbi:MAG: DnaJ domain-containing protein, partial [Flavobacteriales bacterium]|nr:DnaJ domain-containing protein [Flavobacteriales bacterium]